MNSCGSERLSFGGPERNIISRRLFLSRTIGGAAGLALIAYPRLVAGSSAVQSGKSREEILKELEAQVDKFMPLYRTCSQSSFAALNEQFELQADLAIPALMPFAGGIAGKGETCGAVSGSMLALGTFFESKNQPHRKEAVSLFQYGRSFCDGFEKAFSSTRCREVVKFQFGRYYDFMDPEEQKLFMAASQKSQKCVEVIKKAVGIAGSIILDHYA